MLLCRTCLSKSDLKPIFHDTNLARFRSEHLFSVCGVKIEENDGLSQSICTACLKLVNAAFKLREQSAKAEKILKKAYSIINIESEYNITKMKEKSKTELQYSKTELGQNKTDTGIYIKQKVNKKELDISKAEYRKSKTNTGTNINQKENKKELDTSKSEHRKNKNVRKRFKKSFDSESFYTVFIEDFESSEDSDFMNDFLTKDLSDDDKKISIEDFESSDSCEEKFKNIIKKEALEDDKFNWEAKKQEFLERGQRKLMLKEQDQKLLSLAVTPYNNEGPIRCNLCHKELRNIQTFRCHAKTHYGHQFPCEECGKKFVSASHVRYHQQRVHGRHKRLSCVRCYYTAVDTLQLQNHMRAEHTGERPYECDVCAKRFRMRANIVQHMRKHFGVKNLQCDRCPAMFRSRSELTGHQNRVHYLIYTYLCYLCPDTFKRPATVKKHLVNVHGVPRTQQLPIKCIKTRRRSSED